MKTKLSKEPLNEKWKDYFGSSSKRVRMYTLLSKNKAIAAGGSVLAAYTNGEINDIDIYVNQKHALSLWKGIMHDFRSCNIKSSQPKKDYDDSFFKKNKIKGRIALVCDRFELDIIVVDDEVNPETVVSNFDLTFCEIWTNGKDVYANYPEHVRTMNGVLKDDYVKILIENDNKFIESRIERYREKGFTVTIPENNYQRNNRVKTITSPETWYASIMYEAMVKGFTQRYDIPGLIYLPIEGDYTIEKVTPYSCFTSDSFVKKKKYKNEPYKSILNKYHTVMKPIITKNSLILRTNIGERRSSSYDFEKSLYYIDMSKEFVKLSQFRPLPLYPQDVESEEFKSDENVKAIINMDNPGMIFSCPAGHLHYSDNCGAPLDLAVCGIEDCKYIVGGYQHMLAPGNYFVYIKKVSSGYHFTYYGKFPIYDYKTYTQLLKQANEVNKRFGLPHMNPVRNADKTMEARRIRQHDRLRDDVNKECGVLFTEFDTKEDGSIDKTAEDTYILPCGHLMDKAAVEMTRQQGESSNRRCPFDRKRFLFGKIENKLQMEAAGKNIYILAKRPARKEKNEKFLVYEFKNEEWTKRKNGKPYLKWVTRPRLSEMMKKSKKECPTIGGLEKFFKLDKLHIDDVIKKTDKPMNPLSDKDFNYYKKADKLGYV